jgi:hypothetical protein
MATRISKTRLERIKDSLRKLTFALQAAPDGGPEAADFYIEGLDTSQFSTETIEKACERLWIPPEGNDFERRKYPLFQDVLQTCREVDLTARVTAARESECATCDGMRSVIRTADGRPGWQAGKHEKVAAYPCPDCQRPKVVGFDK